MEIVETKSKDLTCRYNGLYIHSKYSPQNEAKKLAKEVQKSNLIILGGFGLGYLAQEISEIHKDAIIIIYEPNMNLFMEALKVRDFSILFNNNRVKVLVGQTPESIKDYLIPRYIKTIKYVPLKNRTRGFEDLFEPVESIIRLYLKRLRINRNTLLKFGKLWVKNQSRNLPLMGYKSNIDSIFGKFSNIPGIIISAGPSMELIIPYLKVLKDRFLLLAVDTALKSLLAEGIEPDFVMSIDSQFWNAKHLEGAKTDKTILIADSSIQPSALREFKERVYFTQSTFPLGKYFEKVRSPFPKIASGGSVSTNIWDFANKLGLSKIFFIGQDLGYPGNITHYKNSYFENNMLLNSNRINSIETQSFNYIYRGYPTKVLSNNGDLILSDKRMGIYIDWFTEKIKLQNSNNSFSLSPNGCKIDGIEYKDIEELLNYPLVIEEKSFLLNKLNKIDKNFFLPQILDSAIQFKHSLEKVITLADKAYNICLVIEENFKKSLQVNQLLKELTIIDQTITSYSHSQTLSFIIEPFINEITESQQGTALEGLKLSENLYKEIVNTGRLHIKYLNQSISTIDRTLKDK
ncbi:motility associated factor glycosyltransferase family protein [Thiospirochaeta perfilievii]|nr:6-hydroxymethylpterin diphosphokinase MptE-like protein [Thiospirochaeta perfilievii]